MGCTDSLACNYDINATDSANCTFPTESYLDCAGNCINDVDADGICDELEIVGCTDPAACNYDSLATDSAGCEYPLENYLDCDGNCLNDADDDGVCDEIEVLGCTDETACNYDNLATEDNDNCSYPTEVYLDCAGNCINDADGDGVCDESLDIPQGLSPNNDGTNDFFEIPGIDLYPNNNLTIVNRQGRAVFKAAPYENNWDGKNNQGATGGSDVLPEGTYYYEFNFGNGLPVKKGFIYLKRN